MRIGALTRAYMHAAEDLAREHGVPAERQPAFVAASVVIMERAFSAQLAGARFEVPRLGAAQRAMRRTRIQEALRRGEKPALVARREGVSESLVLKIRGKMPPCKVSPEEVTVFTFQTVEVSP